jgi:hypothetical protein
MYNINNTPHPRLQSLGTWNPVLPVTSTIQISSTTVHVNFLGKIIYQGIHTILDNLHAQQIYAEDQNGMMTSPFCRYALYSV